MTADARLLFDGVELSIGPEAVVLASGEPLLTASTAVVNGGLTATRAIINLHVGKNHGCADPEGMIAAFAGRQGIAGPWVGLLTAASTERARVGQARAGAARAIVVATVGLSNRFAAGVGAVVAASPRPGTINLIVVVDGGPGPAALLNAIVTVTEAKALALFEAGILCDDRKPATGTSTDAVVVAATRRGAAHEFGGPATELGWCVARAAREALVPAIARWTVDRR